MNHPVLAVVLLGVCEALVAVLLFTGKITADLRERWRPRIVDRVDREVGQWLSRFGKRYREFMLSSLRFIDLKGLATVGFYTPELDEVFVDVSLASREPSQASGGLLAALPTEVTDRHSIQDFLDRPQPVVLAVTGAPGSGKTTLLRHTARQVCHAHRGRRRTVPILLYLRDHVTTIASTPEVALPDLVRGTLGRYGPDEPDGWFERRLNDGACLVLLDGLDEVARPEDRRGVASWVERQTRQYPKNDYVITSRPQGYLTARIDGAAVLHIRSFTDEQVTRFVHSWYLAIERHSTGTTGEDVRLQAKSAADDLLRRLDGAPGLYDLTVNPLLLTMIATVHRYRGALPGSRADLYSEICQVMLWRRQEAKELPIEPNGDKKQALLRGLAFAMMQRQVRDLPRADVLAEIGPALRRMSRELTAEEFLTDIASNGLLIERESGLCSFAHQTFQEYLAATHIRDKGLTNVLVDAVDDVWWRETTLLYTARSDADPIVRACLASASITALLLAFNCAEQGSELAPELRDHLDDLLTAAFASDTGPERRRLMAGVLLARHLRHLIRTGNGGRVCARPIPADLYQLYQADLYQLYQQDTQGPAPERPTHPETGTEKPILGVHGSDAVAFVHWINGVTGSGAVYRLPNLAEINDSALHRVFTAPTPGIPPHSVWLEPDNEHGQPELWTPAGTDHPYMIDAATLARHVKDDVECSTPTLIRLLLLRSVITVRAYAFALARALALEDFRVHGMGSALAHALTRVLHRNKPAAAWPAEFAQEFIEETGIAKTHYVASPDTLADKVHSGQQALVNLFGPPDQAAPLRWAHQVARNLQETALPIFTRQQPLTANTATAIRLAALCLAAEADAREANQLGDTFREIAAGVTLLERRATGQAVPTETIMPAVT